MANLVPGKFSEIFVPLSGRISGRISLKMAPKKWPIWFQGRWRPKNGHLVLKGLFSEAAAAALSVEELLEHGRLQLLCFC